MKSLMGLAIAAAAVLSLTACQGPDHGVVHNRDYQPAYTSTSCQHIGKTTLCTPQYHPATYELDLWASKDDHGWRYVTEAEYERARVGQVFP